MKPIFKEIPAEDDYFQPTPISPMSAMTALTPLSPFALLYLRNLSAYSGFSLLAEAETKKADEIKSEKTICGCSKTKCLKLYCECFAGGKICEDCNCKDCHNNLDFNEERQSVMIKTKGKNPGAFRVDISDNYKICHCTRSFCMKRYCECYQNGRSCISNCRCKQCKNCNEERTV